MDYMPLHAEQDALEVQVSSASEAWLLPALAPGPGARARQSIRPGGFAQRVLARAGRPRRRRDGGTRREMRRPSSTVARQGRRAGPLAVARRCTGSAGGRQPDSASRPTAEPGPGVRRRPGQPASVGSGDPARAGQHWL
jgi:hypothetical protein